MGFDGDGGVLGPQRVEVEGAEQVFGDTSPPCLGLPFLLDFPSCALVNVRIVQSSLRKGFLFLVAKSNLSPHLF